MAEPIEQVDLTIVGAGPAGIAAAVTAAELGRRVALIDESPTAGGQIWRLGVDDPRPAAAQAWLARAAAVAERIDDRSGHAVVDAAITPEGITLSLHREGEPGKTCLRARALLLACGARERFLPFPGWTLPGVVGVGALQALCKQGFDPAGKQVVLAGSGPLLLAVAADLRRRGATVRALVEQAPRQAGLDLARAVLGQRHKRRQAATLALRLAGVEQRWSSWPVQAHGKTRGEAHGETQVIAAVTITDDRGQTQTLACDLLAVGFGLVPETRLARLLGCDLDQGGAVIVDDGQRSSVAGVFAAGEQCGIAGVDAALIEGQLAARVALSRDDDPALRPARAKARAFADRLNRAYALRPTLAGITTPETVVCPCEDVSLAAIQIWPDARAAKLHSRCGMGPCQGRVCEPALEFLLSWQPPRCRPPLRPLPLSALCESPCNSKA